MNTKKVFRAKSTQLVLTLFGVFLCASAFAKDISVKILRGPEMTPYLTEISVLAVDVYREYPYFFGEGASDYQQWLQSYANSKNSLISVAFDEGKIVGVITGLPLAEFDHENYKAPFIERGADLNSIFYMGEFALLPKYRGEGLDKKMYKKMKKAIKEENRFAMICIAEMGDSAMEPFLKTHGFEKHSDMQFHTFWKNINEENESPHLYFVWTKSL